MSFQLNKQLEKDSYYITDLALCQVRLMNSADFHWLILIPRKNNLVEITDLTDQDYQTLTFEIRKIANLMREELQPDKLNIAAIGNVVSQLHVHIIARYKTDKFFPSTVWGKESDPYAPEKLREVVANWREWINK